METINFLDLADILYIHKNQILEHGGINGVRDKTLLESALSMPMMGFGDSYVHNDIFEMAAAYAYHLIKNHPFLDGNKRTGTATAITFLEANDIETKLSDDQIVTLGVDIATSKISKEEIAELFKTHSLKH